MDVMIPLSQLADMLIVAIVVCTIGHLIGTGLGLLIEFTAKKIHEKRKEKKALADSTASAT